MSRPTRVRSSNHATRLSRFDRWTATSILVACVVVSAFYHLLEGGGLERSSALFLGLPLLIGLVTTHMVRTKTQYGHVLQVNILFLVCIAPLLGEASLCILMAAPLFIGVSMLTVMLVNAFRRPGGLLGLLLLPLSLGVVEERTDWMEQPALVVVSEHTVAGSLEDWRDVVRKPVPPSQVSSWWIDLGFPRPLSYRRDVDGSLIVDFTPVEGQPGSWRVNAVPTPEGVRFELLEDSTKVARWLELQSSSVELRATADGQVVLQHTTRCVPLLSPRFYFDRIIRRSLVEAHALALRTWSDALAVERGDDRVRR